MTWPFFDFASPTWTKPFCELYFSILILLFFRRHRHCRCPVERRERERDRKIGVAVRGSSWDPMGGGASCAVQIKRDTTEISGSLSFFFFSPLAPKNGIAHKTKMSDKMTQIEGNQRKIFFFSTNNQQKNDVVHTKKMKIEISSIGGRRHHIIDEFVYSNHLNFFRQQQKIN
jgi:hypothetical protein